jgi:hypothetical protein
MYDEKDWRMCFFAYREEKNMPIKRVLVINNIRLISFGSGLFLLTALLWGCKQQTPVSLATPASAPSSTNPATLATPAPLAPPANSAWPQNPNLPKLFIDVESVNTNTPPPHVAKSRLVKVNLSLLLDEKKQPRTLDANTEMTINLFPEATYIGVIERVEQTNPGSHSWIGHLKGVEYSMLIMVFSGGIFIANISSPHGVYEVSIEEGDLYRIVLIDQSKLRGEEGNIQPTPTSPTK